MEHVPQTANETMTQEQMLSELLCYEKKNLLINRIKLICAMACVVICTCVALILAINVRRITREVKSVSDVLTETGANIDEVAKDLNEIDFEALSASVKTFADVGTETIEQIKTSTQGLDTVLEEVRTAVENLSSININELNNGIRKLNDVLEPLAQALSIFH